MGATRIRRSVRDQVLDLDTAIAELQRARDEMRGVPETLTQWARHKRMVEPMARLDLVRRFVTDLLRRNGWRPEESECDADDE